MGLLDTLFAGGMQGNPEPDPQEAMLADLFRKLQASQQVQTQGVVNPGASPAPDTGRVGMFSPSSAAASSAQLPPAVPPLQERPVQDAPQPGVPYAAPPPGMVPQDIAAREAAQRQPAPMSQAMQRQAPAQAPQREASFFDHLGRLAEGYSSGGLIGGIARMGNTSRDMGDHNQTVAALAQRIGDPQMARMIASDPSLMKAIIPSLFAKEPMQMSEIYDAQGRPQKVLLNSRTGQHIPVGGAKGDMTKPPQGYEWTDPSNHSAGVRRLPGFEDKIPGEVAGKVAMMTMARERIARTRSIYEREWGSKEIAQWTAANSPAGDISALSGDIGMAQRDIRTGIEAALRTMTGAAAPEQEVVRYMQMFMPNPKDTKESAKQKIDGLMKFMEDAEKLVLQGRGVSPSLSGPPAATAPPTSPPAAPQAAPPPQAPAAAPQGRPDAQTAIREAQAAIAKGANPAAVRARLMQMGIQLPPET